MEKTLDLRVKLFGAFRKYHTGTLSFSVADGASITEVKEQIAQTLRDLVPGFRDDELIEKSALATNRRVLTNGDCVEESMDLAILPPVCGG